VKSSQLKDVEKVSTSYTDQSSDVTGSQKVLKSENISDERSKQNIAIAASSATKVIDEYVNEAIKQADIDMLSNVTDNMPDPFDIKLIGKGKFTLSLPENIKENDRLLFRQIVKFATILDVELIGTTQKILVSKETPSEKDFFYGFFKMLTRTPLENETFSFNFDSTSAKGAAQAKLIIMQKSLKGLYADVASFLPTSLFTEKGGRRLEIEVNAIASTQKSNTHRLTSCIVKLVELWLNTTEGKDWSSLALKYKVATPLILEGLHRKVVTKVRNKDEVRVKKPKRPSKRIEVLSPIEAKLIAEHEKAFDDYKKKCTSLGKEIEISSIKKTREELSTLIRDMWTVVEKFSAPLTKRRTALVSSLTEGERKKLNFNKAFIDRMRNENFATTCLGETANTYTLSPIPILNKCGDRYLIDANKIRIEMNWILIPDNVGAEVQEIFQYFATMINRKVYTENPRVRDKRTKHNHRLKTDDDFDDNVIPEKVIDYLGGDDENRDI